MKKWITATFVVTMMAFLAGESSADLLAYYADGTASAADHANAAGVTADNLRSTGLSAFLTKTSFFNVNSPAGPTAGSNAASHWLHGPANGVGNTPANTDDYFSFTVTADDWKDLNLTDLTFDITALLGSSSAGGLASTFEIFVSKDFGAFGSYGTISITNNTKGSVLTPQTVVIDLSAITGVGSVEIRIALGDNSVLTTKASWVQGIRLTGAVVPGASVRPKKLWLPAFFSDNMVLQRDKTISIWGWGTPGKEITVQLLDHNVKSIVNDAGKWTIELPPLTAGGPYEMTISEGNGNQVIRIRNILIGEVWLSSGQSNMHLNVKDALNSEEEIANANYPTIRFFKVGNDPSPKKAKLNVKGSWQECSPKSVGAFSAVAYFFGRNLNNTLAVPVGLIDTAVGGSPAEAWIGKDGLKQEKELAHILEYVEEATGDFNSVLETYTVDLLQWLEESGIEWTSANEEPVDSKKNTNWSTVNVPDSWANIFCSMDGIVYYKKTIDLPADWEGKNLILSLGRIKDCDKAFFNGVKVGETGPNCHNHERVKRVYKIPGSLVQRRNVMLLKVLDYTGLGGFAGPKHLIYLKNPTRNTDNTISLSGKWEVKPGTTVDYSKVSKSPTPPLDINGSFFTTTLYNSLIAPLATYSIRGVIWYQGESNTGRSQEYKPLFTSLIRSWRKAWGQGDFPFYFVQLASLYQHMPGQSLSPNSLPSEPTEDDWTRLREAQLLSLSEPNTGMAVAIDIGNPTNVHPKNKQDVGKRLALIALNKTYQRDVQYSGPIYKSMTIEGDKIRLEFDHVGKGVVANDGGHLKYFSIAGNDRDFKWATAQIDGDSILVWAPAIEHPVAVRYAWYRYPEGANLYNKDGLPASSFRTDNWPYATK